MKVPFVKMHGAGNDYIYVDGFRHEVPDPARTAIAVSDRHFGVGGDGLILILPSGVPGADARMRMFNADGSEGRMCGNGIRCVGKYLYDSGLVRKDRIAVETLSGIKTLDMIVENGVATGAVVDMGAPVLDPKKIPVISALPRFIDQPLEAGGRTWQVTCVSMGNPHAVIFTRGIDKLDLPAIGPLFERHEIFPESVNTEFVEVVDRNTLRMRVWERGSGETLACGTGACAVAVAAALNDITADGSDVRVILKGGELVIRWDGSGSVFMTGPAAFVFEGSMEI